MEGQIYTSIINAMGQINAIAKGRKNSTQGFQYRGIDEVMNELHPILTKCGIFIVPTVLDEQRTSGTTAKGGTMFYTRLKIKFTFYAKDGSSVESIVIGEAMDSGDKASNKALSIGLKYALLQVFCIPTEDDKDPDATSVEGFVEKQETKPERKPAQNPEIESAEREKLLHLVDNYEKDISDTVYDMCCGALVENDEAKIKNMLDRLVVYLGKKGIRV